MSTLIDGRFALESERGRGGMGVVWRARDLESGAPVAVKVLHAGNLEQVERFRREGELLARLAHSGIVSHVAHGTSAERLPYLVMEWLEGETVAERLARQPLTLHESLALVQSALRSLAVAHEHGIVHRDVKPSNLFLRGGDASDVVLLDLGLARHVADSQRLTRSGSVLGTPAYMAPEQAQGKLEIAPACDVYSVGCLLFECLTGAPPFVGPQAYALLAKVLFEPPPRLCDVRPELPAALEPLVAAMLEKDPARRWPDARRVLLELAAIGPLSGLSPPGTVPQVVRPSRGEQELVGVILAAPGAPLAGPDSTFVAGAAAADTSAAEVAQHGGELRRLADGTAIIVLSERGGAATDLAARAARCALRLSERANPSRPVAQLVVAIGRGIRDSELCLGEAVDRAGIMLRALDERSPPGIWLDEVTAGLLDARFRVTPRHDGLTLFLLAGEDPSVDSARLLLGRPTACVGRERELGMLELTLVSCIDDGQARAVLVTGPPGIGKSRLRHEFLRGCQRRGGPLSLLMGFGDPLRRSGAGSVLGGALARWCGSSAGLSSADGWTQFAARVGRRLASERELTLTFLAELCGVTPPSESPELRAARQNPNIMADRTARAWVAWLRAEASVEPVLLVLDDLQWSDAQTVQLVGAALRELEGLPFMVLALARPEVHDVFPELWAPRLGTLPLGSLPKNATRRLIRQVLGEGVSDDTVQRIVAQAGGNALYLEELIRAADARRERAPETVLAMLQARIGLLSVRERRVLRTASVFGEHFPLDGVQALLDAESDSAELDAALVSLTRHEVLERPADETGAGRWRFRHALMCDAAYALLTPDDLVTLHGRAAAYLETSGEDPGVVAAHAERGNDVQRAVRHYALAAERAYRNNDLAAVVSLVERGIRCGAQAEQLAVLLSIEAPALSYRHDFAAGWAASEQALALLPPGHPKRLQSLAANTFAGIQLGKVIDAQIEELLAAPPAPGGLGEYVSALGYAGIAHVVLANRGFARRVIARLRELDSEMGDDAFSCGHSDYWQMRYLEMLGDDPHETWRLAQTAAAHNERAGNRRMLCVTLASLGECERRMAEVASAERLMRSAIQIAREVGEPISWSFALQYLANLLADIGADSTLTEADALASEAIELAGDGQAYRALALTACSGVAVRRGELDRGERLAREAHSIIRAIRLRAYYPQIDAALFRALLARGDVVSAHALALEDTAQLAELGPLGLTEPTLRLWIVRALQAAGDPRAGDSVRAALAELDRRALFIPDPARRARFSEGSEESVALRRLARDLGV
ncbi:MAG TPA: protein kinase [Polyangiaceae bacterium]|nr:protein kinase [Polyangiaceae bacterium]